MHIYLGSDHGGYHQKEALHQLLQNQGHSVTDCGTYSKESTDYPDFAVAVGQAVSGEKGSAGILLCRSGEGMEIAVNKVPKIRAALVWNKAVAEESRRDNDANIVVLPADFLKEQELEEIVTTFLSTPFSGEERHIRRLEKLHNIEHTRYES